MTDATSTTEAAQHRPNADEAALTGFALLQTPAWEPERLRERLEADWGEKIEVPLPAAGRPWFFPLAGSIVVLGLEAHPLSARIGEDAARSAWPLAEEVAHNHLGAVIAAVVPESASLAENARTYAKVLSSLSKLSNVMGIATAAQIFSPAAFRAAAAQIKEKPECFPAELVVYFGVWQEAEGAAPNGCTFGLGRFALPEIEVEPCGLNAGEIRELLEAAVRVELEAGKILKTDDVLAHNGVDYVVSFGPSIGIPSTSTLHLERAGS